MIPNADELLQLLDTLDELYYMVDATQNQEVVSAYERLLYTIEGELH